MHDRDAPIRYRIKAASTLLRLFPHDWDAPRLKYIIGGIPSEALGPCQPRPAMESTEKHSHFSAVAHMVFIYLFLCPGLRRAGGPASHYPRRTSSALLEKSRGAVCVARRIARAPRTGGRN